MGEKRLLVFYVFAPSLSLSFKGVLEKETSFLGGKKKKSSNFISPIVMN